MDNILWLSVEDIIADAIRDNKYSVVISSGDEDFMLQFNKEVRPILQDIGFYVFPVYKNTVTIDWKQNPEAAKQFTSNTKEIIKAADARDIAEVNHLKYSFEQAILSAAKNGELIAHIRLDLGKSIKIFEEVILSQLVDAGYDVMFSNNKNGFCEITIDFSKE